MHTLLAVRKYSGVLQILKVFFKNVLLLADVFQGHRSSSEAFKEMKVEMCFIISQSLQVTLSVQKWLVRAVIFEARAAKAKVNSPAAVESGESRIEVAVAVEVVLTPAQAKAN